MPRLPDDNFGAPAQVHAPNVPSMPSPNVGGEAIARGIQSFGNQLAAIGEDQWKQDTAEDLGKAHAAFTKGMADVERDTRQGGDYDQFGNKILEGGARVRDEAAANIRDPHTRETFKSNYADVHIGHTYSGVRRYADEQKRQEGITSLTDTLGTKTQDYVRGPAPGASIEDADEYRSRLRDDMNGAIDLAEAAGTLRPKEARQLKARHIGSLYKSDVDAIARTGDQEAIGRTLDSLLGYRPTDDQQTGGRVGTAMVKGGMVDVPGLEIKNGVDPAAPYMARPRDPSQVKRIVIHGDVNTDADALLKYGRSVDRKRGFDPNYHFYIGTDGTVTQGVPIDREANHAWKQNNDTIGIVLAGADGGQPQTPDQDRAAKALVSSLGKSLNIPHTNVFGHGEIAPPRGIHARAANEGGTVAPDIRRDGYMDVGSGTARLPQMASADGSGAESATEAASRKSIAAEFAKVDDETANKTTLAKQFADRPEVLSSLLSRYPSLTDDTTVADAGGILERAPTEAASPRSNRWYGMDAKTHHAVVYTLRTAMSAVTQQMLKDNKEEILRGEDGAAERADAAIARARKYLQPNQINRYVAEIEQAKAQAAAVNSLRYLPEDQMSDQISRLSPGDRQSGESAARLASVQKAAIEARDKLLKERNADPAAFVDPDVSDIRNKTGLVATHPTVAMVKQRGSYAAPEVALGSNPSKDADTPSSIGVRAGQDQLADQKSRARLIDARLEAQREFFRTSDGRVLEEKLNPVKKREAIDLLGFDDKSKLTDVALSNQLRAAADRAETLYGPEYARQVFEGAVRHVIHGKDKSDMATGVASGIISKMAFGDKISDDDLRRYRALSDMDDLNRAYTGGGSGPSPAISQGAGLLGKQTLPKPKTWYGGQNWPAGQGGTADGGIPGVVTTKAARPEDVEWAMADPQRRAGKFDQAFGEGAFARVMSAKTRK